MQEAVSKFIQSAHAGDSEDDDLFLPKGWKFGHVMALAEDLQRLKELEASIPPPRWEVAAHLDEQDD